MFDIRRREFITLIGSAAVALPLAARAQQPKMPAIGLLDFASPELSQESIAGIHRGMAETGYVEGQNVTIEYRGAEGRSDRLPTLAADLVRRQVAVIVTLGAGGSEFAAKAATSTIPILFNNGNDPVKLGLVASLNRPDGNLTGVSNFAAAVATKRLGLLSELVPAPAPIAALLNPNNVFAKTIFEELQSAARAVGREIEILNAGSESEIDSAFARLVQLRVGALFVSGDGFFTFQRHQLVALAARHAVPASYSYRRFTEAGGLMSYGANLSDTYRQLGVYAGRILKGAKPADLPVLQPTKFELVINLKTGKALGLAIPDKLFALADEVIE